MMAYIGIYLENLKKLVGQNIRKFRKEAGFKTQESLARALDVDQPRVAKWESGRSIPDQRHRTVICKVLGITEEQLQAFPNVPKPISGMSPEEFQRILDERLAKQTKMLEELKAVQRPQVHSSGTTAPLTLSPEEKNLIAKLRRAGGAPTILRSLNHVLDQFLADQIEVSPKKRKRA